MNKYRCWLDDWSPNDAEEWETTGGYHTAAEEFAKERDAQEARYPDERPVWVQDVRHDTPRRFIVTAEATREYYAEEAK